MNVYKYMYTYLKMKQLELKGKLGSRLDMDSRCEWMGGVVV